LMMSWVKVLSNDEPPFRQRDWAGVEAFLSWAGILVNRHRLRQVELVCLDEHSFYVKKQFAVTWKERFLNAWHGFGWCSTAVREAKILQMLQDAGVGCPQVAAYGETRRQAFVLLKDATGMTELRCVLQQMHTEVDRQQLAIALGSELARLHDAGFTHPDLFAKHILVSREGLTFRICFLDWQRGRRRRTVAWPMRCRDLAALDATLHELLASDRLRLLCLRAYLQNSCCRAKPQARMLAQRIRRIAMALRKKRNVRELAQLPIPATQQQFITLCEGRLLLVRSYYDQLQASGPEALAKQIESLSCSSDSAGSIWELPPQAHTLFRLHCFGVPGPRLLAAASTATGVCLLCTEEPAIPLGQALPEAPLRTRRRWLCQAGWIVRQIHEAGYGLRPNQCWMHLLGVSFSKNEVMLADVESLQASNSEWQNLAQQELPGLAMHASFGDRLSFLRGYLQRTSRKARERVRIESLLTVGVRRYSRQVVT
jgi:tRNA A-37 threonylcarbamoyl transferase component Bud32